MKVQKLIDAHASFPDGALRIRCITDEGEKVIEIERAQIVAFLNGIVPMPIPAGSQPIDYGRIAPTSIQPFLDPDGTTGLCVFLGAFALPIAFPPQAIPALRQNIDEMELLGRPAQGSA